MNKDAGKVAIIFLEVLRCISITTPKHFYQYFHICNVWALEDFWMTKSKMVVGIKSKNCTSAISFLHKNHIWRWFFTERGWGTIFFHLATPSVLVKIWSNRLRSSPPLTCFKSPESIMAIPCVIIAGKDSEGQKISQIFIPYQFTEGKFSEIL